jgi:hypothetical protein
MKKTLLLTIALCTLTNILSCKKETENEPVNEITAEKTNVSTYELVDLIIHGDFQDKFSGTIGTAEVLLIKTSDSTLSFLMPDIPAGEAILKFELASIRFNVTQTPEVDMDQLVNSIFEEFDTQVSGMSATTPEELAEIDSMNQFKNRTLALINSLNAEQRRMTGFLYEANKDMLDSFVASSSSLFKGSTNAKAIDNECPNTDFRSKYTCYGCIIGDQAASLNEEISGLRNFLQGIEFEDGNPLISTLDPLLSAIYLKFSKNISYIHSFHNNLKLFLNTKWILSDEIFYSIPGTFISDDFTPLNLDGRFRTVDSVKDNSLLNCYNPSGPAIQSNNFFQNIENLKETWLFYRIPLRFPDYVKASEPTSIIYGQNVEISVISNTEKVILKDFNQGNSGLELKFKSLSGEDENFTFKIKVTKEGFSERKEISAIVSARQVVTTLEVINITSTTALGGGNISGEGIVDIKGVCWSQNPNPTILTSGTNHTNNGSGLGSFSSNITNLEPDKKYYVRAYATNSSGTTYGNEVNFTTVATAVDSTEIYEAAVVGNWTVTNAEYPNNPARDLEIYSGGYGKYVGEGGQPFPNGGYSITWWIEKKNNKYYLFESGFWHPGYNQFRRIGNNMPLESLSYPITMFKTYGDLGSGLIEQLTYIKN